MQKIIKDVLIHNLTYLDAKALCDLYLAVAESQGSIVECGTAFGGSALVMSAARFKEAPFYIYDTFAGMPPPSEHDGEDVHERYDTIKKGYAVGINATLYYGYKEDLLSFVKAEFVNRNLHNNVEFIQGNYKDTLHPPELIGVAHIDCDWYESVKISLERIWDKLLVGGIVIVDDYYCWSGCKKAVDEFLRGRTDYKIVKKARLQIVKTEPRL